ncbi:MAG: hemerythrin [Proteobacteria bacterium ST_bin11]|nr:MAG: hemerythrin [Proteobacteria bacterium ST_bin11]
MPIFENATPPSVGHDLIDTDHSVFIALLNQMDKTNITDFPGLFLQLYEHTAEHFEREHSLMAEFNFPAETEHNGEHQRLLGEFKQFKTRVDKGLIAFGRAFIKERLPQWFTLHISTMDSALAAHIKRQRELPDQ